jgi:hypothetical protein
VSKDAPDPPDYTAAAQQQAESSREVTEQQTWANRPTINTPFGQQTWEVTPQWDPATGQYLNTWTMNTNLTPESQAALDSQMRIQQGKSQLAESMLGRSQDEFGEEMDWSKFQQLAQTPNASEFAPQRGISTDGLTDIDPSQRYYDQAEDAIFNKWASRQEPRMQQDSESLRTQLYNQGLREGDEAYDREMQRLRESQNDAREQAQYQATIGAGQEAQRMFGMDSSARGQMFNERQTQGGFANQAAQQALNQQLQTSNYQNTLRQQQISEEMQRRGFSLNEINAILNGQQVGMPSMPGFNSAQRSEPVQYNQAAQSQGQAALDAFNAGQMGNQGWMSALSGGAMMFSDRRLKKNIREWTYDARLGLQSYMFNYVWEEDTDPWHFGFMADEVEKLYPEAVMLIGEYKMVNYGLLNS